MTTTPPADFPAPAAAAARAAFEQAADTPDPRSAAELYLRAAAAAEAAREWLLAAEAEERAADLLAPADPARAARLLQRAAADYDKVGQFAFGRRAAYREAGLKLWRGGELGVRPRLRAELFVAWLTSGFGLRPGRVLWTALATAVGFALVFWLGDGVRTPQGERLPGFADALYLSGVTLSTVGFGDVLPARHLRLAAVVEGWAGLILFGYYVAVLTNRLRH